MAAEGGVAAVERARLLEQFRSGELRTLVCTGLASRGLDFVDVVHVLQYEVATNAVEFLHRAGRTARAGKAGVCTSLYTEARAELVEGLRDAMGNGLHDPPAVAKAPPSSAAA